MLTTILSLVPAVHAGDTINLSPPGQFEVLNATPGQIIQAGLSLVLIIAAIVFFFMLIIGGIRWILSGGDKAQTEAARNQITAALVGLVVVFGAWAIAELIATFFGIEILNFELQNVSDFD